jgi:FKBP-type peptidyl-prolyl cis-trans isomerase 2
MSPGDRKIVGVAAAEAYGPRLDENIFNCQRSKLPADADPQVGQQVQLEAEGGRAVPAVVTSVSESTVTVDANHPLAGQDLRFDLELVEIV